MELRSKPCLICSLNCSGTRTDLNKLRENANFEEFLKALGEDNRDGLNTSLINLLREANCGFTVCGKCQELIWEAMEWKGRVVEVEDKVLKLQKELLEELGKLEEFLGEYGGKLRRIRENVKMEVVQLKFEDEGDEMMALGEDHLEILNGMGMKMDGVVADLDKFQDNLSAKIDEKRIKRLVSRKKIKSVRFLVSDSDDDPAPDKQEIDKDDPDFEMDDGGAGDDDGGPDWHWSPDDSDSPDDSNLTNKKKPVRPTSTNQKHGGKKLGKRTFRKQVYALIRNREKRLSADPPDSNFVDVKFPIHYDPTLEKITIGGRGNSSDATEIKIIKDKCNVNHLQCTICDYQTPNFTKKRAPSALSVEAIYDHVIIYHYGGFICDDCGKVGPSRKKFLEHLIMHKDPESFLCEICARPCKTKESKKIHQFTHFSEEEKRVELAAGKAPWLVSRNLKDNEEGTFICGTCGKCFGMLRQLKKHEPIHRNKVICPKCGKSVTRNWYKIYHSVYKCPLDGGEGRRGEGQMCFECGKTFVDLLQFKKHIERMHSEEARQRRWICDKCGKGYKCKGDLRTHGMVHSEEMNWRCEDCGREFNQKRNLKRHACKSRKGEGRKKMGKESGLILGL